MCFSAEASFSIGAALMPAGGYCVYSTFKKGAGLVPLALIPFAFAAQQLSEGLVWIGLSSQNPVLTSKASVFFLFFAIPFWPFWIPCCLAFAERQKTARWILTGFVFVSLVWIWVTYPLLREPERWLTTRQVYHSVQYDYAALPAFRAMPLVAWQALYFAQICLPFLVVRRGQSAAHHLVGGAAVAVFFLIARFLFSYAFTSVWCFFAAILSLYLCFVFYRLPVPANVPATANDLGKEGRNYVGTPSSNGPPDAREQSVRQGGGSLPRHQSNEKAR
jgi:hypothetical protein